MAQWLGKTLVLIAAAVTTSMPAPTRGDSGDSAFSLQSATAGPDALHRHLQAKLGAYDNSGLAHYIATVAERITNQQPRPTVLAPFLLDSGQPISLSLAPNRIYIDRGLLPYLDSEAELAAVIALELGRIEQGEPSILARHTAQDTSPLPDRVFEPLRALLKTIRQHFGSAMPWADAKVARRKAAPSDAPELSPPGLNQLAAAPTRGVAEEAAFTLVKAGYAAAALGSVLQKLAALSNDGSLHRADPGYLDENHSLPTPLIRAISKGHQRAIGKRDRPGNDALGLVNREDYLAKIEGIPLGPPVSEGFARGKHFFHPDMGFALTCPQGYWVDNRPERLLCVEENGEASIRVNALLRANDERLDDLLARTLNQRNIAISSWHYHSAVPTLRATVPYGAHRIAIAVLELPKHALVLFDPQDAATGPANGTPALDTLAASVRLLASDDDDASPPTLQLVRADGTSSLSRIAKDAGANKRTVIALNAFINSDTPSAGALIKVPKWHADRH